MKMEQSFPKRRHIKFRRRGIAQKKAYIKILMTDLNFGQNFEMLTHSKSLNFSIRNTRQNINSTAVYVTA